jgi:hypothetical protein
MIPPWSPVGIFRDQRQRLAQTLQHVGGSGFQGWFVRAGTSTGLSGRSLRLVRVCRCDRSDLQEHEPRKYHRTGIGLLSSPSSKFLQRKNNRPNKTPIDHRLPLGRSCSFRLLTPFPLGHASWATITESLLLLFTMVDGGEARTVLGMVETIIGPSVTGMQTVRH